MPISVIANDGAGSANGNSVTLGPIDTRGARQIIVVAAQSAVAPGLVDSEGNTWNDTITEYAGGGLFVALYFINLEDPVLTSETHTFTVTDVGGNPAACVAAFAGAKAVDQTVNNSDTAVEELGFEGITPTANGALVVAGLSLSAGSAIAIAPEFAITDSVAAGASNLAVALAWFEQAVAGEVAATWTWTGAANAVTQVLSFLPFVVEGGSAALRRNVCTWGRRTRGR